MSTHSIHTQEPDMIFAKIIKDDKKYLTDSEVLSSVLNLTGLTEGELREYVGSFRQDHWRFKGLLRGYVVYADTGLTIKHHFTNKILFSFDY